MYQIAKRYVLPMIQAANGWLYHPTDAVWRCAQSAPKPGRFERVFPTSKI
ncbi:MAG: hypothetical protein F6K28_45245 [Microcoleus sp. SIO2G3]|nr:hypothetical protein [Microcoleus sp. SIO2G3]